MMKMMILGSWKDVEQQYSCGCIKKKGEINVIMCDSCKVKLSKILDKMNKGGQTKIGRKLLKIIGAKK